MPESNPEAVDVDASQIRRELGHLVRFGAETWWLADKAPTLMQLGVVTERLQMSEAGDRSEADFDDPEQRALALRSVLTDVVDRLPPASRRLRTIVLALDGKYSGASAEARRAEAGRLFRGDKRQVTWGTIRQYHEPKALDALTERLVEREDAYRHRAST